jgi:hypothetical protein
MNSELATPEVTLATPEQAAGAAIDRVSLSKEIDALEVEMMKRPAADCPVTHRFTPGLYIREIFMPAGAVVVSKIHRTEHPFTISQGRVLVMIDGEGWKELAAPYTGVTKPGTRRVLQILEDTVWTTYHPTTLTDVDEIESQIIEPHNAHRHGLIQPRHTPAELAARAGEAS